MLARGTDYHFGYPRLSGAFQCFTQQNVCFGPAFFRGQEVGLIKETRVDIRQIYKFPNVHGLVGLDGDALEIFLVNDNVAALLIFIAFNDVPPVDLLAVGLRYTLVMDATLIAIAKHVEIDLLGGASRGIKTYWNV